MKLKILVKIAEKLLGMTIDEDTPRADMYLPERLLAMGLVMLAGGTACAVGFAMGGAPWMIACAVGGLGFGLGALLCYRNQSIRMISQSQFAYTTFLGNTYTYAFSQIQGLRRNQDSMTLFVAGKKVHIESMAILSDRLVDAINRELAKKAEEQAAKQE